MIWSIKSLFPASTTFSPKDKVVLITGGANGIGLETAKQLYQLGAKIAIIDLNEQLSQQACKSLGKNALAICANVTDRQSMQQAAQTVIKHFGQLDLVIANAGITPQTATLRRNQLEDFDKVLAVNVTGVLNTVHPAIEALIQQQGHIVVVASCAAFCPPAAGVAYMVSKAAVEQLARGLKLELAPYGVSVTTAYFGIVDTQLAKATLDNDPVGQALNHRLPSFLKKRLSSQQAGQVLVNAICQRAAVTIAPIGWTPYAWLRGIANPIFDQLITRDKTLIELLKSLDKKPNPAKTVTLNTKS